MIEFSKNTGGVFTQKIKGLPFIAKEDRWSIGIYTSDSPFTLAPSQTIQNPIMTARQVTDIPAKFVADPFMVKKDSRWYMFFEVLNTETGSGKIGLATSNDGLSWSYEKIVLDETIHLSYPYVFEWHDKFYMIPESRQANSIRLYQAIDFPTHWTFTETLLIGNYADPSIFRYDDKWWLFAETNPSGNDTLCLYYADELTGPWFEHPKNPIIKGDASIARPGGRVLVLDNLIYRFAQDDRLIYGAQLWAFKITELTTRSYQEKRVGKLPLLKASGTGWNGKGMHHIDLHQVNQNRWIACVDGVREQLVFGPGY